MKNTNDPMVNLISIDDAAISAKVSTATIKNWVGPKRLTGRANKSQKDSHDHGAPAADFKILLSNVDADLSALSDHYESSLSDSFRNKEGVYYTPKHVVENLFEFNQGEVSNLTFLDPCCGSGHWLNWRMNVGLFFDSLAQDYM